MDDDLHNEDRDQTTKTTTTKTTKTTTRTTTSGSQMRASHSCTKVTWYTSYTWDVGDGSAQRSSDRTRASHATGWPEYKRATKPGPRSAVSLA